MFARVSTFEGRPDTADESITDVREQVLPAAEAIAGFAGMVVLVDRTTGKSLAITFWDSDAAPRESEGQADRLRNETAGRHDERIVSVERFEVPLATLRSSTGVS